MKRNAIQIEIELGDKQKYVLVLTAENYKQQFKKFIQQRNIDPSQSFYLKNIIQSKIIALYRGYQIKQQQPLSQLQQIDHLALGKIPKSSPRFGNCQQKQTQTLNEEINNDGVNYLKTVKKSSQSQSLFSTNIPSQQNPHTLKQENKKYPTYQYRQEDQLSQVCFNNIYHQQSEPNILTIQKTHYQSPNNNNGVTKKKAFMQHSSSQQFNRLYETPTESFRSKRNKEVNPKQQKDYSQMEKYMMDQKLKRTTNKFFHNLHKKQTASFTAKTSPSKQIQEQEPIYQSPPKKIKSPSKGFVAPFKLSGCRCQMKIIEAQQLQRKSKSRQKQQLIRQRMIKQKSSKKPVQQNTHKSRSCQKCNPQQKKQSKPKKKKVFPEPKKSIPHPYISNILAQSYNEYKKQFSLF